MKSFVDMFSCLQMRMLRIIVFSITTRMFSYYSGDIDKASDYKGLVISRN